MGILLDTHVLLWWLQRDPRLSSRAQVRVADAKLVYVSTISIWEVAIKVSSGRSMIDVGVLVDSVRQYGFIALPVRYRHAVALTSLPPIHRDPFDRMLVAQSLTESLVLLTADRVLSRYPANVELV
jgi:PIN domain nuclease of toxin-antitoxin system